MIIWKGDKPELAPWRKEKMERELQELDEAEQYVLIADLSGFFPCYSCVTKTEIFLNLGEVWRYGVTRKGEKGRYFKGMPVKNLAYLTEFEGTLQECLREEKLIM